MRLPGECRKPGTGSIQRKGDRWFAYGPETRGNDGKRTRTLIGSFDFKKEAAGAIDEWLRQQQERKAS